MNLRTHSRLARTKRGVLANTILGLTAICLFAVMAVVGFESTNGIPGRSYYTVHAELRDAGNLAPHAEVRVAGNVVGQVLNPRFENGHGVLDLQLDTGLRPLGSDSWLRVRPRSAIGEPYVDLHPSIGGRPIPDGGTLAPAQSSAAVPLDQVLSTLDPQTRQHVQKLVADLGLGVAGRGEGMNRTLMTAPAMVGDMDTAMSRLAEEPEPIRGFVRYGAATATAFANVTNQLAGLFAPAADVMNTLWQQRAPLRATLATAPGALDSFRGALVHFDPALVNLRALAVDGLPALRAAPSAFRAAAAMLRTGTASVPPLNRTLLLAQHAVPPTLSLLNSINPVLSPVKEALNAATPNVVELAPRRCDIIRMARNWENMLAFADNNGRYLAFSTLLPQVNMLAGWRTQLSQPGAPLPSNPYPGPCVAKSEVNQLAAQVGQP